MPRVHKECSDCGADFFVTEKSQLWLESQGWSMPKRCFACREKKKARNSNQANPDLAEPWNAASDTVVDFFAPVDNSDHKDGRVRRRKRKWSTD